MLSCNGANSGECKMLSLDFSVNTAVYCWGVLRVCLSVNIKID